MPAPLPSKSKGAQAGGCCCGGCWSPPRDLRGPTTGVLPQFSVQSYCCKCIPKQLCVRVSQEGAYDESYSLAERACDTLQPEGGGPLQFTGTIWADETTHEIEIFLEVRDEECWIVWEVVSLGWVGEKKIDHNIPADIYECDHGMKSRDCVKFGGTWQPDEESTLTIGIPETLDIANTIDCGGCSCMCRCLCISVWSRDPEQTITIVGTNEVVCADVRREQRVVCGELSELFHPTEAIWEHAGWVVRLAGGTEGPPVSEQITIGTGNDISECGISDTLLLTDDKEHIITADDEIAEVIYEFDAGDETGLRFRWVGNSDNALVLSEKCLVEFFAYDWVSNTWDLIGSIRGRNPVSLVQQLFRGKLEPEHTGTGVEQGRVQIKIRMSDGFTLKTNQLILTTTKCCELELIPPYDVPISAAIPKHSLAADGQCPSPFKFWQLLDDNDVEWYVAIDCSWCGGKCGSSLTGCCPRPIPRTVFAEILIDCPPCGTGLTVPLQEVSPAIWEGEGWHCGSPLTVRFSCNGSVWALRVEGAGACFFQGEAVRTECDPLNVDFAGEFGAGIGCCGTQGNGQFGAPISVTVVE